MGLPPQDTRPPSSGPHLVLYDGECGLCQRFVQFVLLRDRPGCFHFASLQGSVAARFLAPFGGVPDHLTTVYVLKDYQTDPTVCWRKARAALFVFRVLGWPWRALFVFAPLPTAWLDAGYDWVARNRHRVFGGSTHCLMPTPEQRGRFLDPHPSA